MREVVIDTIRPGLPTLSMDMGRTLSEAAVLCLDRSQHASGVPMRIVEGLDETVILVWRFQLDPRAEVSYDADDATESGAACIAILLTLAYTDYATVQRSWKGTGFDYWVGPHDVGDDPPFQRCVRLEVSGILKGTLSELRSRTRQKIAQTEVSDATGLPAIISVIEFGAPCGSFVTRCPM